LSFRDLKMHRSQFVLCIHVCLVTLCFAASSPQEPHYRDGEHNERYTHEETDRHQTLSPTQQLAEDLLNGNEIVSTELYSKFFPVETITEGLGFMESFANVVAVDTSDGLVLIDSGHTLLMDNNYRNLRKWSTKPVHTIILTHGHYDHIFGITVFDQEAEKNGWPKPRVISHAAVVDRFERYKLTNGYNSRINAKQFAGLVKEFEYLRTDFRYPDLTYNTKNFTLKVGNIIFELHWARGETDDITWVHMPAFQAVASGDLFAWTVPNAGNPQKVQRYPGDWAVALREIAALNPKIVLPGHGPPLIGQNRIYDMLTTTSDYLQSLVDQTLELMNQGHNLNYIIHNVRVPEKYKSKPYLTPVYDEPEFIVRNIWRMYGGWWDLNPANLKPPRDEDFALEIIQIVGGSHVLARRAYQLASAGKTDIACSLVELAYLSDPEDPDILWNYIAVYRMRAEDPSVTSLMAKAIYKASVVEKQDKLDNITATLEQNSLWTKFKSLFWKEQPAEVIPPLSVSKEVTYEWLEKMNIPTTNPHYKSLLEATVREVKELAHQHGDWEVVETSHNFQFSKKHLPSGIMAAKAELTLPFPPKAVFAFFADPNFRSKWDPAKDQLVDVVDARTTVKYRTIPARSIIKGRDFAYVAHWTAEEPAYYAVFRSVEHDQYPVNGMYVRMSILGGYVVTPANEEGTASTVVFVEWMDAGLMDKITLAVMTNQANSMKKLQVMLQP